jgi:hypothetical protein
MMKMPFRLPALGAIAVATAGLTLACTGATAAAAGSPQGLNVVAHPAIGGESYFTVPGRAGHAASAGTLEVANNSGQRMTVTVDPVDALTSSSLGAAFRLLSDKVTGSAVWTTVGSRRVTLSPHKAISIPVAVSVPAGTAPGDYLSGIAVQAVDNSRASRRGRFEINSQERYVVAVFSQLPGARRRHVVFTGARVDREPSGLTFFLNAANTGNALLQNVQGHVLITEAGRTIASYPLGPGTFVADTRIAYPLLVPRMLPTEGTTFRVQAYLRYQGGIARLDTLVRFGHASAERQAQFGGPPPPDPTKIGGIPKALVAALIGFFGLLALTPLLWLGWRRRRPAGRAAALAALERALDEATASDETLTVIGISCPARQGLTGRPARAVRRQLAGPDRLYRVPYGAVVLPGDHTPLEVVAGTAAAVGRTLRQAGAFDVTARVVRAEPDMAARTLLSRATSSQSPATPSAPAPAMAVGAPQPVMRATPLDREP